MFAEWVTAGVAFGIKAFFAGFSLMVCAGVLFGLMALICYVAKGDDDGEKDSDKIKIV